MPWMAFRFDWLAICFQQVTAACAATKVPLSCADESLTKTRTLDPGQCTVQGIAEDPLAIGVSCPRAGKSHLAATVMEAQLTEEQQHPRGAKVLFVSDTNQCVREMALKTLDEKITSELVILARPATLEKKCGEKGAARLKPYCLEEKVELLQRKERVRFKNAQQKVLELSDLTFSTLGSVSRLEGGAHRPQLPLRLPSLLPLQEEGARRRRQRRPPHGGRLPRAAGQPGPLQRGEGPPRAAAGGRIVWISQNP
uniref:DNA recombination and repair protein Rad51-like C-terminal domain-containing protein n=1 Tax=Chromera velia CCMP2878 TaxID=1169474 RepID=A0A0G4FUR5_9ALVE|eukprot:Cvel_3772.t1-p1 / transcript=Cvel_3772.t1 / gene=Cvel_3772 / organism=Chromera_velia_CCMP2878 / gene_product=hypothetical protein / transcript_product=hypothetical protein / location=Cvel_scaffold158:31955-33122(-) / protein_length=253 / sequence_SO=supercontig / SO=protein_coding / is_pseudo=false